MDTPQIIGANPQEENLPEAKKVSPVKDNDAVVKKPTPVVVTKKGDVQYNGFQRPFHPLQVVSWVVFFFDFATYFLINMVSLVGHSLAAVIICSTLYFTLSVLVLYYGIKATKIDPSDPTIYEQRFIEAQG